MPTQALQSQAISTCTEAQASQHFRLHIHFDNESQTFWAESPDIGGLVVGAAGLDEAKRQALLAADTLFEMRVVKDVETGTYNVTSPNLSDWSCEVKDKEIVISTLFDCISATDDTEESKKELSIKIKKVCQVVLAAISSLDEIKSMDISIGKDLIVLENHPRFIRTLATS